MMKSNRSHDCVINTIIPMRFIANMATNMAVIAIMVEQLPERTTVESKQFRLKEIKVNKVNQVG